MVPSLQTVSNAASRSGITAMPHFPDNIASDICSMSESNAWDELLFFWEAKTLFPSNQTFSVRTFMASCWMICS